jgi:glycosyltransferase involved in cell wall biosynthesis
MHSPDDGAGRVLFLTSNYPRWAGDTTTPFVHDLAVDLAALGWQVTVLAPHAPGAARRERLDDIDVHRFRYLLPETAQTVCYGGGALVNLREARSNKAKLPALVAAEWAATARALGGGFDVLHAHWTLPQGFVAATTPHRRVARVLTVHGGDVFGLRGRALDRFSARALRGMDQVTVASSATEAAVREIAGAGAGVRVTRVPIGVDLGRAPRTELVDELKGKYRRSRGPLLVFVGRVVEEKGVLDIVQAVARLATDLPGVEAAIVGTGQHVERVRQAAAGLGVADRVHLPGWADPQDVPSWFAAADVVLAPSKVGADGWTEGQGLSIVEAMALGRPVVATRTGGIPDTITDGVDGLLVAPGDPGALADAIRRLVDDPTQAARLGTEAAVSVRARFDRSVTAAAMDSLYRAAIDRRTGS